MTHVGHPKGFEGAADRAGIVPPRVVKSAGRVLEILEFFDGIQRSAKGSEIAEQLGYPYSSTSALLRSLVNTGYLLYDKEQRTFWPSSRVALLGSWIQPAMFHGGLIMRLMQDANRATGETVVLSTRNGLFAQFINILLAPTPQMYVPPGILRPLAASASGHALLSMMGDKEIGQIVYRLNAESRSSGPPVVLNELLKTINRVRSTGYSLSVNQVTMGGSMLAMPLPRITDDPPLVLGIAGITEVVLANKVEFLNALRRAIKRHANEPNITNYPSKEKVTS